MSQSTSSPSHLNARGRWSSIFTRPKLWHKRTKLVCTFPHYMTQWKQTDYMHNTQLSVFRCQSPSAIGEAQRKPSLIPSLLIIEFIPLNLSSHTAISTTSTVHQQMSCQGRAHYSWVIFSPLSTNSCLAINEFCNNSSFIEVFESLLWPSCWLVATMILRICEMLIAQLS